MTNEDRQTLAAISGRRIENLFMKLLQVKDVVTHYQRADEASSLEIRLEISYAD